MGLYGPYEHCENCKCVAGGTGGPGTGTVDLSKVESPRSIRVQTQVGRVSPAWCTSTGRILLAYNAEARERVLLPIFV